MYTIRNITILSKLIYKLIVILVSRNMSDVIHGNELLRYFFYITHNHILNYFV